MAESPVASEFVGGRAEPVDRLGHRPEQVECVLGPGRHAQAGGGHIPLGILRGGEVEGVGPEPGVVHAVDGDPVVHGRDQAPVGRGPGERVDGGGTVPGQTGRQRPDVRPGRDHPVHGSAGDDQAIVSDVEHSTAHGWPPWWCVDLRPQVATDPVRVVIGRPTTSWCSSAVTRSGWAVGFGDGSKASCRGRGAERGRPHLLGEVPLGGAAPVSRDRCAGRDWCRSGAARRWTPGRSTRCRPTSGSGTARSGRDARPEATPATRRPRPGSVAARRTRRWRWFDP